MSKTNFVHLHVHTEYSMLDGAARIGELVDSVAAQGMPAIAMTDHGNVFGAFEFWRRAKSAGVKPIIGTEAYLTPGTHRSDRTRVRWASGGGDDVSGGGAYTHMTLLAQSTGGMHNLFRLSSRASIEGYYFKPRMDREILAEHANGLIATTGCPSGEVQTRLRLGQYAEAKQAAAEFQDIFGKENFFCELMDHGLEIERRITKDLLRLASELQIPLVATNDLHYVNAADATAHDALLCVQAGSRIDDTNRFKFDGTSYYLKTPVEMRHLFREFPEACDNTLLIAERCEAEFDTTANYMPRFPVPEGETEDSWLVQEVKRGLAYRYPDGHSTAVQERAEYELSVITQMGFAGYFLVVADFINWAKNNGIRVGPGRGSGAGSMVAYLLRITDLDPLVHSLFFERFLNPDRVSMPDFDVDFDDRRRGEVINYVTEKYGDARVAQIVTYGTIKSKQALKDSARVLGYPYIVGEKLTKAMPPAVMGKDIPLSGIFDEKHPRYREAIDIRTLIETDPEAQKVFEVARGLEGLKRQWGVHAAGVIMSSEPLLGIIPLMKREADGQIITQFDYPSCESLGLIKMDFLGLRNLTIVSDALENIKANRGIEIDLESLELTDKASYDLLARGDTLGVFQLDGDAMRSLLRLMKPDNFEDISAVLALYRPGPMGADSHTNYALRKNKRQEIVSIHPELAEPLADILDTTYGLIVYQEQVMTIAQRVAGYSLGQADILRRVMGKKKKSELDEQFVFFSAGMRERGYSEEAIKRLWDIMVPFADYAFNKAHSAAYGVISYWTAYLKAHYPAEYMAALLTGVGGKDKDKLALYLNECRKMKIEVLPPDVNESVDNFAAVGDDIRFGLGAVRNVGHNVVSSIIAGRKDGKYVNFGDFIKTMPTQVLNKRTIESLIKAGAFDSLGHTRRALMNVYEDLIDHGMKAKRDADHGKIGFDFDELFAQDPLADEQAQHGSMQIPEMPEYHKRDKLAFEREMIGLYVSDHPLKGLESLLAREASHSAGQVVNSENSDGDRVTVAGLLTRADHLTAKSGNAYGKAVLEDFTGEVQLIFTGQVYGECSSQLVADQVVAVSGQINARDDGIIVRGYSVRQLNASSVREQSDLNLRMTSEQATRPTCEELLAIFKRHAGTTGVQLHLSSNDWIRVYDLEMTVRVSGDLYAELKVLLGPHCVDIGS
ncbi:DNA polymerase III subunit alpha [Canibacter sp. lx-45]|uniref:DNA polymerase III subunit alpha n=1 Tax=Canibacter zhuwentaonis TaxID=2837491 RepID=UPI001BDD828C|nr:DNA polymerase III subunit alpha [Canibacter zhuwentaonis]